MAGFHNHANCMPGARLLSVGSTVQRFNMYCVGFPFITTKARFPEEVPGPIRGQLLAHVFCC